LHPVALDNEDHSAQSFMTAVCGKRSYDSLIVASPKRPRFSSPSSCALAASALSSPSAVHEHEAKLAKLREYFPHMNDAGLNAALDSCGGDLLTAIQQLNGLRLEPESVHHENVEQAHQSSGEPQASTSSSSSSESTPSSAAEWVEVFVQQMAASGSLDDARSRAANLLGAFEQFVSSNKQAEADAILARLNSQLEKCTQENTILKKAVTIQHSRNTELQEALKTSELNNYSLSVHLKQMDASPGMGMNRHIC